MATLSHFLNFPSLFAHRHKWQHLQHQRSPHKLSRFRASSIKKSRKGKKTNAELCNDIREFASATGLPEGHVPTMKEFSQHGRSDLAYIVRRRGYKLIGELLGSKKEADLDESAVERGVIEDEVGLDDDKNKYKESNDIVGGDFQSSVEVPIMENGYSSLVVDGDILSDNNRHLRVDVSADLDTDLASSDIGESEDGSLATELSVMESHLDNSDVGPAFNIGNHSEENATKTDLENSHVLVEASADSENDLASSKDDEEEDGSSATESSIIKNHLASSDIDPAVDSDNHSREEPAETSTQVSLGQKDLDSVADITNMSLESSDSLPLEGQTSQNGLHENYSMVEEVPLSTENLPSSANVSLPVEISDLSLEEKAANFIQHGHLDTVEDSYDILMESGTKEGKGNMECVDADEVQMATSAQLENVLNGGSAESNFNGNANALRSMQVVTAMAGNSPLSDENLSVEGQSTQLGKNLADKASKKENHVEINHLKFMLHEKELELSRLKEEIEKEKRALSLLQAKAETEISKAQKLISEKDAELQAAEEMLSELIEVVIQYHGDGEIVEVAGSFNGWHHWIKMDPQPSSRIRDTVESGKFKLWSAVLWLYPGIYEIKFIVDGQWKNDPKMESVTHGAICNNILRVHR